VRFEEAPGARQKVAWIVNSCDGDRHGIYSVRASESDDDRFRAVVSFSCLIACLYNVTAPHRLLLPCMVSCQRRVAEVAQSMETNGRRGVASEEATGQALTLRTDGGSRGNPGHAAAGIVIERVDGSVLAQGKRYLGVMTNNQAEYRALLLGLTAIQRYSPSSVRVLMDSELIVRQMRGEYKVRDEGLRELYEQAVMLTKSLPAITFAHVPRAQNSRADALVNQALDEREQTERIERQ